MMAVRRTQQRTRALTQQSEQRRVSDDDAQQDFSICCCPPKSCFSRPRCKAEVKYSLISSLLCVVIIVFVIYDLIQIARYEQDYADCTRSTSASDCKLLNDNGRRNERELERRHDNYMRQRTMAIVMLLLLLLLIAASVMVYMGVKFKRCPLLLPYLVLTFPLLTVTMIYAILFRSPDSGSMVYIKIISVVVIYTVLANIYRGVYRLYRGMRLGLARNNRRLHDLLDQAYSVSAQVEPVVIQMKPPPYEKEPPAYSLRAPDVVLPPEYTMQASPVQPEAIETEFGAPPYSPPEVRANQDTSGGG